MSNYPYGKWPKFSLNPYYKYRKKYYKFRNALFQDVPRVFKTLLILWILMKVLKFTKFGRNLSKENPFKNPNTYKDADTVAKMGQKDIDIRTGLPLPSFDKEEAEENNGWSSKAGEYIEKGAKVVVDYGKKGAKTIVDAGKKVYGWIVRSAEGMFNRNTNEVKL